MTFNIKPWFVFISIHTKTKLCSYLFVYSLYIKAFCKLQVAKAGVGVAILLPLLTYIKKDPQKTPDKPSIDAR